MEFKIQEAMRHSEKFPDSKNATVAREFGVPHSRLRYRLEERRPKARQPALNTKLTGPEEKALCRYIDRLDKIPCCTC
jgi:hypothetical protein